MDQLCSKLHPEADKGCTDAGAPAPLWRETENRRYSPKYPPVLSEPFGFALTVPQSETDVDEQIVSSPTGCEHKKTGNYLD